MLGVQLALEAPDHVIGIHFAGGLEVVGGVEFDALSQFESVRQTVGADLPAFSQARYGISGAWGESYQAFKNGFGRGICRDGGRVLHDIETFRARLGADHQRFGRNGCGGAEQRNGNRRAER